MSEDGRTVTFVDGDAGARPLARTTAQESRPATRAGVELRGAAGSISKTVTLFALLIGMANAGLLYIAPETSALRLVLASAMLWVAALPSLEFAIRTPRQAPLFPLINAFYFMYFGLPVFLDTVSVRFHRYDKPEVTVAVAITLAGLLAMQLAFFSPIGKIADALPRLKLRVDLERVAWMFIVLSTLGVVAAAWILLGKLPPSLRAVANTTSRMPLVMLSGVLVLHLRGQATFHQRLIALALYVVYLLLSLATGAMAQVMWALVPMFFVYVAERGRIPWAAGLLCLVLVIPFAHAKHAFRREIRRADYGAVERVSLFLGLTYDGLVEGGQDFVEDASRTSGDRISYLGTFAYVIRQTPGRVPYMDGETYRVMLWSFVPRVLAPSKPTQELGQQFGHRYGLLNPRDYATSFNCAQIVEMYLNFGHLGVLVGMALVGLYYRALYALFNHGDGGDGMLLVASSTLAGLLNIESDASMVLVGAFHAAAFGFVVLLAVQFVADRALGGAAPR